MRNFDSFFLMNTEDVKIYVSEKLGLFETGEELECSEIGDGNINYVFKVRSVKSGKSLVVKQADRLLRSSGRPLDIGRSRIEAAILKLQAEYAPEYVPHVYDYNETMAALTMEDISDYKNLRLMLSEDRVLPHLAENISSFMADTLLPTTDLVMDRAEKKRLAAFFTNPELCDITEDLVLTEPYYNYKSRNIITCGNEVFVENTLYNNLTLHAEIAALRDRFMNCPQALIHGDLHSGSIFINEKGLKVIDPEFAFYGPMGYDIGNVIGNLFFALASKEFCTPDKTECISALRKAIADVYDLTMEKLSRGYDRLVSFPLYKTEGFKAEYISSVMQDAAGYAGTEIIRRVVGDSKVRELVSVTDLALKIPMERKLIELGIALISERKNIRSGSDIMRYWSC